MLIRAIFLRTGLLAALWWVLTGGVHDAWLVGSIAIAAAVAASLRLRPPSADRFLITGLAAFFIFFLRRSVKAGMQVALMALRPRLELHPDIVELRLHLPHDAERVLLASMLNLLPGTISIALEGNLLKLHVLDARLPIESEVRTAEERIARLFGVVLQ